MKRLFATLLATLLLVSPVSALTEAQLDMYDSNNIYYYNPDNCKPTTKSISSNGSNLTVIGDSLTEGTNDTWKQKFPKITDDQINGKVSRRWDQGIEVAKTMDLKDIVVFALGTNSPGLTQKDIDDAVNTIGLEHTIVFVTNHTTDSIDYDGNNQLFKTAAQKENILLADWQAAIQGKESQYLWPDGVHPNPEGQDLFVQTIYDAINNSTTTSASSVSTGDNKAYDGTPVFEEEQWNKIQEYKPIYEEAAKEYDLPWGMLAVIHIRESGQSTTNPSNGQGIFQIFNPARRTFDATPGKQLSEAEFLEQTKVAAKEIKDANPELTANASDDIIKHAFFAYNGMAKVYITQARELGFSEEEAMNGEGSPYVMNRADERRDPTKGAANWGQIKRDLGPIEYPANTDFGAFVMYVAMGGSIGTDKCAVGSTAGNKDLTQTAIDLAWPIRGEHDKYDTKPSYRTALHEVGLDVYGDPWVEIGSSCDAFVATVYRYSGIDPDFACCGVGNILEYMLSKPDMYQEVENSPESLRSGDIRIRALNFANGHVEMYVEVDGVGKIASASYGDRTGEISDYYENASQGYRAFRYIGNGGNK